MSHWATLAVLCMCMCLSRLEHQSSISTGYYEMLCNAKLTLGWEYEIFFNRGGSVLTLLCLDLSAFQFGNSRLAVFMSPNSLFHSCLELHTSAHYVILQDQGDCLISLCV